MEGGGERRREGRKEGEGWLRFARVRLRRIKCLSCSYSFTIYRKLGIIDRVFDLYLRGFLFFLPFCVYMYIFNLVIEKYKRG